jgi:hypothetical protein
MKYLMALCLLLLPVKSFAAWHLYLIPVIGTACAGGADRCPKYLNGSGGNWSCMDYGYQPSMICSADTDATQDAALVKQSDVTKIPDNLDSTVGAGALTTVQNALESRHIPGTWVTTATTYRTVIRAAIGAFTLFQRYISISGNTAATINGSTVTLNTVFSSLPSQVRTDLIATAINLELDTSGITGANTLRQILLGIGNQFLTRVSVIGGITI